MTARIVDLATERRRRAWLLVTLCDPRLAIRFRGDGALLIAVSDDEHELVFTLPDEQAARVERKRRRARRRG